MFGTLWRPLGRPSRRAVSGLPRVAVGDAGGNGVERSAAAHAAMLKKADGGACRFVDQPFLGESASAGPTRATDVKRLRWFQLGRDVFFCHRAVPGPGAMDGRAQQPHVQIGPRTSRDFGGAN